MTRKNDPDMSISELNTSDTPEPSISKKVVKGYKILKTIGTGASGSAFLAKNEKGELRVIKQIDLRFLDENEKRMSLQEVKVLRALSTHRHITGYYEYFIHGGLIHIVMEYADGGDLNNFLEERKGKPLDDDLVVEWATQLALALHYVHSKKILHRDLKSQNIFITRKYNRLLLGDFGISRVLSATQELAQTVIGTPSYLSPELYENQKYDRKSDVWALGCIFYELCCLRLPFDGTNMAAIMLKVLTTEPEPVPAHYSISSLIMLMLQKDPQKRPTIEMVLNHPAIRKQMKIFAEPFERKKKAKRPKPVPKKARVPRDPPPATRHRVQDYYQAPRNVKVHLTPPEDAKNIVRVSISDVVLSPLRDASSRPPQFPSSVNTTFDKKTPETPLLDERNPIGNLKNISATPIKFPSKMMAPSPIPTSKNHNLEMQSDSDEESSEPDLVIVVEESTSSPLPHTPVRSAPEGTPLKYPTPSPLAKDSFEGINSSNFDDTFIQEEEPFSTAFDPSPPASPEPPKEKISRRSLLEARRYQKKMEKLRNSPPTHKVQPEVAEPQYRSTSPTNFHRSAKVDFGKASKVVVPRLLFQEKPKPQQTFSRPGKTKKKKAPGPMSPRRVASENTQFLRRRKRFHEARKQERLAGQQRVRDANRQHKARLQRIRKKDSGIAKAIRDARRRGTTSSLAEEALQPQEADPTPSATPTPTSDTSSSTPVPDFVLVTHFGNTTLTGNP